MEAQTGGWTDRWVNERMNRWMDGWMEAKVDGWWCVDRRIDGWVDARMDTQMDGCLQKAGVQLPQAGCVPETRAWPGPLLSPQHSQRQ